MLCACQQAHIGINIFMLNAAVWVGLANGLALSDLQNVSFWLAKQAFLKREMCRFKVQNGSFQGAKRHIRKIKAAEPVSSCIFASMGRLRVGCGLVP